MLGHISLASNMADFGQAFACRGETSLHLVETSLQLSRYKPEFGRSKRPRSAEYWASIGRTLSPNLAEAGRTWPTTAQIWSKSAHAWPKSDERTEGSPDLAQTRLDLVEAGGESNPNFGRHRRTFGRRRPIWSEPAKFDRNQRKACRNRTNLVEQSANIWPNLAQIG